MTFQPLKGEGDALFRQKMRFQVTYYFALIPRSINCLSNNFLKNLSNDTPYYGVDDSLQMQNFTFLALTVWKVNRG